MEQVNPKDYTTFKVSEKVTMYAIKFKNQYQMEVGGHLFILNNMDRKTKKPAIIVGHPMGAVKEQSSITFIRSLTSKPFLPVRCCSLQEIVHTPENLVRMPIKGRVNQKN